MELIQTIADSWGWVGIDPVEVVGDNEFGNLIIRDRTNRYWRLCPEDTYCELIADDRSELDVLSNDQEFLADWNMLNLVSDAKSQVGALIPGYKYCLKIPSVLGGEYKTSNMGSAPLIELVALSGHIAKEIDGLPDGAKVEFRFVE